MSEPIEPAKLELFVVALANGHSVAASSRRAEVSPRTGRRWAANPKVQGRVAQIRTQITGAAVGKLARLTSKAAVTLGRLLTNADAEIQLKAARGILSDFTAVHEHALLMERVKALEGALEPVRPS